MTNAIVSRLEPSWYTPSSLPKEIAALEGRVQGGLQVGAPGKVGLLELRLATSGGVTRLTHQYQRAPLHVFRPIYLDPVRPDMAFIFLQQSGDGFVQGDRQRVDIDSQPGSAAHVTTQTVTNVFGARSNYASQLVNLSVSNGAVLEYLPEPVVPFRGSRLFQRTCLTVGRDSTVIIGETLLPGRVAHNEAHVYDCYRAEFEVRGEDGKLLFADLIRFSPKDRATPESAGLLGGYDIVSTLYFITSRANSSDMVSVLRSKLAECPEVLGGASELPNSCGSVVRLLGDRSVPVRAAFHALWHAARVVLLGSPAPNLRKG